VSTVFQCDHVGMWHCLSNVHGRSGRDKFVVAIDDQRRDPKALELGEQVVLG
jgi:hypothetical protein